MIAALLSLSLTRWDTGKLAWNWDRCNKVKCFNYVKFGPMNPAPGMFEREQDLSHLLKCPTAAHLYAFEVFSRNKSLLGLIFIRRADWRGRGRLWPGVRLMFAQAVLGSPRLITLHRSHPGLISALPYTSPSPSGLGEWLRRCLNIDFFITDTTWAIPGCWLV